MLVVVEDREQTLVTCVVAYLLSFLLILEEELLTGYKTSQQCLVEKNQQEKAVSGYLTSLLHEPENPIDTIFTWDA